MFMLLSSIYFYLFISFRMEESITNNKCLETSYCSTVARRSFIPNDLSTIIRSLLHDDKDDGPSSNETYLRNGSNILSSASPLAKRDLYMLVEKDTIGHWNW